MKKIKATLLTRKQIIKIWEEQNDNILDMKCCNNCRNILEKQENGTYVCHNCEIEFTDDII